VIEVNDALSGRVFDHRVVILRRSTSRVQVSQLTAMRRFDCVAQIRRNAPRALGFPCIFAAQSPARQRVRRI